MNDAEGDEGISEELVADGAVSVPEAVKFVGLSRTELYARMERGELPYVKAGRRRLIPRRSLIKMLAGELVVRGRVGAGSAPRPA